LQIHSRAVHFQPFRDGKRRFLFIKVDENNVTIAPVSPYIAGQGSLSRFVHYYLGWRRDEIFINNQDLVTPANSYNKLVGLNSPKVTLTLLPKESWLVALSFGRSFFTEDPSSMAI
jgi:hypothetical protein